MADATDRFCFNVEWYDTQASLIRQYLLIFYPDGESLEMYDLKNRRTFLKRQKTEVKMEDLYIGATLNVMGRQLKVVTYGDEYTQKKLSMKKERTLGLVKPDCISKVGQILEVISQNGFLITKLKMCRLSRNETMEFYGDHRSKGFFNDLVSYVSSGPVVAFELVGSDAIGRWRDLLGPTDSAEARSQAPHSIRARFGTDKTKNACHGSDSAVSAGAELEFFFPAAGEPRQNTALLSDCTCCLIKPHAVLAGQAGAIVARIAEAGFEISAMQMFHLDNANAEEFLEVYKGVVQEYPNMVKELTGGPLIALEVRAQDAAAKFREFTGPADPEIARHLRPRTLRAQFGRDKIQNAVHCTDLPEDGLLEVEYFFNILDK